MFVAMLLATMLNQPINDAAMRPLTPEDSMFLSTCETYVLPQSDRWVTACSGQIIAVGDFLGNVRFRNLKSDLGWSFATVNPNDLDLPNRF